MISVLMPVFNEEKFVKIAIESIVSQSYQNIEIVIVDDQSEDSTLNIVKEFAIHDARIRVFSNPHKGKVKALNYGFVNSSGQWIMVLAGDDILEENIFSRWIDAAKYYDPLNDMVALVSKIREFSEEKEFKRFNGIIIPRKDVAAISGTNYIMSRAIAQDMFPLPDNYPNEDGWTRLSFRYLNYKTIFVPGVAVNYRRHSNNSINPNADFSTFNDYYHKRKIIVREFIIKKRDRLSEDNIKNLINEEEIEHFRYNGMVFKILFSNKFNIYEKFRNIMLCRPVFYKFKLLFERFLIGRIMK